MQQIPYNENSIFNKIRGLPPEKLEELNDFIDFLAYRAQGHNLHQAINKINSATFNKIWDNDEDSEYDKL